jgi:hypothetical protein
MQRDINLIRDFESGDNAKENYDMVLKKRVVGKILESDPDILELLDIQDERPLNKFKDANNPTQEELDIRNEIETYNMNIKHNQICPYIKLNGIQNKALNYILYDIRDEKLSYDNRVIKIQYLEVYILVHESNMDTEYGLPRIDLLDWIVKDLLNWSNALGKQLEIINDTPRILDNIYYSRHLTFKMETPNGVFGQGKNPYDKFERI